MIVFPGLLLAGVGKSGIIQPYGTGFQVGQNNGQPITSLGLIVTISPGASLTYTVEVSGDYNPVSTGNWNPHEVLVNKTANANSNIVYPVSGVRLSVSIWTSGTVNLAVVQWP